MSPMVTTSASSPYADDVRVGDEIPSLTVTPSPVQLFLFSAATLNPHRIHYDHGWAVDVEGLPDVVVHGPLQGALMRRAVTDWLGPRGRIVDYAIRHRRPTFVGHEVRITGRVVSKEDRDGRPLVGVEVAETDPSGNLLSSATMTVTLPTRDRP